MRTRCIAFRYFPDPLGSLHLQIPIYRVVSIHLVILSESEESVFSLRLPRQFANWLAMTIGLCEFEQLAKLELVAVDLYS